MIFNGVPKMAYMVDSNGHILSASIIDASIDMEWNGLSRLHLDCDSVTIRTVKELKDINPDIFQAMMEDGYGTGDTEIQKEVAEETA